MTKGNTVPGLSLPMDVLQLVPHRPPMLLVSKLVEKRGTWAKVRASWPGEGMFHDTDFPFYEYYIELVAQSIAAAQGYEALEEGRETKEGMLVGIDSFSFSQLPDPEAELEIEVELEFEFGAVKIIKGLVYCGEELLAQGKIKVWEKPAEVSLD